MAKVMNDLFFSEKEVPKFESLVYGALIKKYIMIMFIDVTNDYFKIYKKDASYYEDILDEGAYSGFIKNAIQYVHPDDVKRFESLTGTILLENFKNGNDSFVISYRRKHNSDEYHWMTNTFILGPKDGDEFTLISFAEISDKEKEIENNLKDALITAENANKAKSDFLSRMSHDIRTPMNAIIGITSIAKINLDDRKKMLEHLEKIDAASRYLLALINDILDMSSIESGKMAIERTNFNILILAKEIETIMTPQIKNKHIKFTLIKDKIEYPFLWGDTLRIKQIIINLLSNGVKFSDFGGEITIKLEQKKIRAGWVNLSVIVSDNGIGMSDDAVKKAFQPFEQGSGISVNYGGTGLGLSIVKSLVQMMNGYINAKSEIGKGTIFTVNIPLEIDMTKNKPETEPKEKLTADHIHLRGKHVLLAEDDFINAEIATTILNQVGIISETAQDGAEVYEKFRESEVGFYDAILMDIQMPKLNGFQATEKIRASDRADAREIPIIAMTANAFIQDIAKAKEHGMNDHLAKPIDVKKLYQTLSKYMSKDNRK